MVICNVTKLLNVSFLKSKIDDSGGYLFVIIRVSISEAVIDIPTKFRMHMNDISTMLDAHY